MKMKNILFITCLCLILNSCSEQPLSEQMSGQATMDNGTIWIHNYSNYFPPINGRYSMTMVNMCDDYNILHDLAISNFELITGKQTVYQSILGVDDQPSGYFHTLLCSRDEATEAFDILESKEFDNWINIERIDNNSIEGSFQLALVVQPNIVNRYHPELPDTIFMPDGYFKSELFE